MGALSGLALNLLRFELFDLELQHLLGVFQMDDLLLMQVALDRLRGILLSILEFC